jgi:hypothetical protein
LNSPINQQHVKGHQDASNDFQQLSYIVKSKNALADYFATKAHTHINFEMLHQAQNTWTLEVNNKVVTGNLHHRMKTEIFKPLKTA